jgi:hypothetical protein
MKLFIKASKAFDRQDIVGLPLRHPALLEKQNKKKKKKIQSSPSRTGPYVKNALNAR